eukprot:scaffold601_cov170-Ochromonas_danica.AAC.17
MEVSKSKLELSPSPFSSTHGGRSMGKPKSCQDFFGWSGHYVGKAHRVIDCLRPETQRRNSKTSDLN